MDQADQPVRDELAAETQSPAEPHCEDSWDVLGECVEAFLAAWDAADEVAPRIADHLPGEPTELRHMALVELVKIDLEYRRKNSAAILSLEDYVDQHPELSGPVGLPADLIHEEFHIRHRAGESITVEDYLQRFPDHAETLSSLFDLDPSSGTTSLTGAQIHDSYEPGDRIGDFLLMAELGEGAFGFVYLARQESMQRMVALKVSGDYGSEGQTLAQLDHPHIVRVYDQCHVPEQNLGLLYMQFVGGGTLQSVIRYAQSNDWNGRDGRLFAKAVAHSVRATGFLPAPDEATQQDLTGRTWPQVVCRLGSQLASALHYAHSQGILHRDVKPANVLLEPDGSGRLADFNISSSQLDTGSSDENFGGSVAYMSPEQLEAFHPDFPTGPADLDQKCDIYSLGVVLWETLYGSRPFPDEQIQGSWKDGLSEMIASRREAALQPSQPPSDNVERELVRTLQRCMTPARSDRFCSADLVARQLALCQHPRVARLLQHSRQRWPQLGIRWPITGLIIGGIIPNAVAGVFNYAYNHSMIIRQLMDRVTDPQIAEAMFGRVQLIINSIAFPLGLIVTVWFIRPVLRALRKIRRSGEVLTTADLRGRALATGGFVAALGIVEWTAAGIAYPLSLHLISGELTTEENVHFFVSLLICGMIAAAYPFFLLSTLAVRSFVPALLRGNTLVRDDARQLRGVTRRVDVFLALAGGVPAAGILALVISGLMNHHFGRSALAVLSGTGFFGFLFTLSLSRALKADIEALLESAETSLPGETVGWGTASSISPASADTSDPGK